jgi:hypothetical protein
MAKLTEKEKLRKEKLAFREATRKEKAKVKREEKSLPNKADALWSQVVRKV